MSSATTAETTDRPPPTRATAALDESLVTYVMSLFDLEPALRRLLPGGRGRRRFDAWRRAGAVTLTNDVSAPIPEELEYRHVKAALHAASAEARREQQRERRRDREFELHYVSQRKATQPIPPTRPAVHLVSGRPQRREHRHRSASRRASATRTRSSSRAPDDPSGRPSLPFNSRSRDGLGGKLPSDRHILAAVKEFDPDTLREIIDEGVFDFDKMVGACILAVTS